MADPTFTDLINAIIATESSGNPKARGKAGELGLMQISPSTGQRYGVKDPRMLLDPATNKAVGSKILTDLLKKYKGNIGLALAAYNAGPGAVKSNVVPAAATGYVNKVLSRLGSALSPASASAAETSNVKEIPAVGPPADIDTRIKAKLADRSRAPGGDIDARIEAKLGRSTSASTPSAPASKPPLPLAVRAADWLPIAGQIGGELGGGALSAETGPGAIAGAGLGGAAGDFAGEELATVPRRMYGLPFKSQGEIAKDAGISGGLSAAGVPLGKVATKIGETIAPSTLKAAIEAKRAFGASRDALNATMKKLGDLLGLDAKAAAAAAASPIERRDVQAAYMGARRAGFEKMGQVYQDILNPYLHRMTPNTSAAAYATFKDRYGARSLGLLDGGVDLSRPTVRMMQAFRSNIRKAIRAANPQEDRQLLADLFKLDRSATNDIKAVLPPDQARRLGLIDQAYADYVSNVPARQVRAIMRAPNAPKAMEAIIKGEPSQVATILRQVDGMPGPERAKALTALKNAASQWIHDQASLEKGYVQQLNAYGHALSQIPDVAFNRLYGPGTKSEMQRAVRATIEFHQKMLAHPDMISAIQAEMKAKPLPWIVRHARWIAMGALYEGMRGDAPAAGTALAIGLTPDVLHVLLNNSMAQKLYLRAVTAQSPKAIADGFRALLVALASQQMRGPIHDPETHVIAEP